MSVPVTLEALDLAALLCSRVCHDLISPSGAIVNGLEVLEESTDEETKSFALDLIKKSARRASRAWWAGFRGGGVLAASPIDLFGAGSPGCASGLGVSLEAEGTAVVVPSGPRAAPASGVPAAAEAAVSQSA